MEALQHYGIPGMKKGVIRWKQWREERRKRNPSRSNLRKMSDTELQNLIARTNLEVQLKNNLLTLKNKPLSPTQKKDLLQELNIRTKQISGIATSSAMVYNLIKKKKGN